MQRPSIRTAGGWMVMLLGAWAALAEISPNTFQVSNVSLPQFGSLWVVAILAAVIWATWVLIGIDKRVQTTLGGLQEYIDSQDEVVTQETIEGAVREWSHNFGFSVQRDDSGNARFALIVTPKDGVKRVVGQVDGQDRYLTIQSSLVLAPGHRPVFDGLGADKKTEVAERVSLELSRAGIGSMMAPELKKVTIMKSVPITPELSEEVFIDAIQQVGFGWKIARHTIVAALREFSPGATVQSTGDSGDGEAAIGNED